MDAQRASVAVRDPLRMMVGAVRAANPMRRIYRVRRAALLFRLRLLAIWHRSTVEVDVAPDLRVGRGVRITVTPRTANVLRIGPGSLLEDRVLIMLKGGHLSFGPRSQLRRDCLVNLSGRLEFVEGNIVSWGGVIHCAESVRLEPLASVAEYVTIADSTHFFTTPDEFFYDNVRTAPIVIGGNTWLCPRSAVTMGVTVGSHCIIASNSVVTRDVPSGHLASGVPATSVKPLSLPWT